jgi:hypothetical protein
MSTPSIGQHLRAARGGFYWIAALECFVRARVGSERSWLLTACGIEGIPTRPDQNTPIDWEAFRQVVEEAAALTRLAADLAEARKDNPGAMRQVEICDHGEALHDACGTCKRAAQKPLIRLGAKS